MASPDVSGREETNTSLTATADASPFEESQISSIITADDAPTFFKEHGVFYKADAEIGRQARVIWRNKDMLKELLMKDPRFARILEPFIDNPPVPIFLGPDQGSFYAFTNNLNQDHRLIVYIWPGENVFDFFDKSHKGLNKGVPASNGYVQIPYSWLKDEDKRNLEEFRVVMKEGGVMIVHLRLALHVEKGLTANGFVYQRAD